MKTCDFIKSDFPLAMPVRLSAYGSRTTWTLSAFAAASKPTETVQDLRDLWVVLLTSHTRSLLVLARARIKVNQTVEVAREVKKARHGSAGRAWKGRKLVLLGKAIATLAPFGLETLDRIASLLHRAAGHEPANGVALPAHRLHDPRWWLRPSRIISITCAIWKPSRGPSASAASFRSFLPRAALAGVAFFVDGFLRARLADCARPWLFPLAFGFFSGRFGTVRSDA